MFIFLDIRDVFFKLHNCNVHSLEVLAKLTCSNAGVENPICNNCSNASLSTMSSVTKATRSGDRAISILRQELMVSSSLFCTCTVSGQCESVKNDVKFHFQS